ncbi:hypothetical protein R5R35_005337 [Gryllus longicercus]|uniref:Peptidase M10 metallopeptidase domain-containing protein n=1 Tax=Gryllus longicercus TaxID=2509291 RepID=A0AAN9Z533_9ORTH
MGPKFLRSDVTYSLVNAPPNSSQLTEQDVMEALANATALWASHTPLNFSRARTVLSADVLVSFQHGEHGLFCPAFDGAGGDLAHTALPLLGSSQLHFDADEPWTLDGAGETLSLYPSRSRAPH